MWKSAQESCGNPESWQDFLRIQVKLGLIPPLSSPVTQFVLPEHGLFPRLAAGNQVYCKIDLKYNVYDITENMPTLITELDRPYTG